MSSSERLVARVADTLCRAGETRADAVDMARRAVAPDTGRHFLVPVNGRQADWDSLVKGNEPPWGLEEGWAWKRVVIFDAPDVDAHDVAAAGGDLLG